MRGVGLVLVIGVIAGSLAGCGATTPPSTTTTVAAASSHRADSPKPAQRRPRVVNVSPTAYGAALTDRRGFALYRFTHDDAAESTCYGACAGAWPPYLVPQGVPRGAVESGRVRATRRKDGRLQVTYAGHPLYYYAGDRRPRQVLCQGVTEFGGGWYVVARSGELIRSP
jgi:predicted lipoprotein with Yx(FWY)xxD motif